MDDEEEDIPVSITNDLEQRIADVFAVYDTFGNKTVDIREVSTIVRALGLVPSEADIQQIIAANEDKLRPGVLHLNNFMPYMYKIIVQHQFEPAPAEDILNAFRFLDKEGHGYLTVDVLREYMTKHGEPFNEDEIEEMIEIGYDQYYKRIPYEEVVNRIRVSGA